MFGFLEGQEEVPDWVERIAFLDANYNFEPSQGEKLARWLRRDAVHTLVSIAYDDREIMLDGKRVVFDSGGTWRATERRRRCVACGDRSEGRRSLRMGYARQADSALTRIRRSGMRACCPPFAFPSVKRHFVSSPALYGGLLGRGSYFRKLVEMQLNRQADISPCVGRRVSSRPHGPSCRRWPRSPVRPCAP